MSPATLVQRACFALVALLAMGLGVSAATDHDTFPAVPLWSDFEGATDASSGPSASNSWLSLQYDDHTWKRSKDLNKVFLNLTNEDTHVNQGLWYTPTETGAYTEVSFQDEPEADGTWKVNFKAETVCVYKDNNPTLGTCTWTYTEVDGDSPAPITQDFVLVTKSVVWQY